MSFKAGSFHRTKDGRVLEILMIKPHRKFPIIAIDKKGVMTNFTADGQFYLKRTSDKDLTSEQVRSF